MTMLLRATATTSVAACVGIVVFCSFPVRRVPTPFGGSVNNAAYLFGMCRSRAGAARTMNMLDGRVLLLSSRFLGRAQERHVPEKGHIA